MVTSRIWCRESINSGRIDPTFSPQQTLRSKKPEFAVRQDSWWRITDGRDGVDPEERRQ